MSETTPDHGAFWDAGSDVDAQAAARALLAVLGHRDVATSADERLLEALMVYGLQTIPSFGENLFRCLPDVQFRLGRRLHHADIIGRRNGDTVVIECEIKLHSNINWASGVCQLDNYADSAPGADLIIVTAPGREARIRAKLERNEVRTRASWRFLDHQDVYDAVARTVGPAPQEDGAVERLACALARLIDTDDPTDQ